MTVALLFLTYRNPHIVWKYWIDDNFNLYIHNKHTITDVWYKQYEINTKVDTSWGSMSLVQATLALLNEAFREESNTHFVLLCDKAFPLVDAKTAFAEITKHNNSCLSMFTRNGVKYGIHSQWIMVTRDACQTLTENPIKVRVVDAIPDEYWFYEAFKKKNIQYTDTTITGVYWKTWHSKNGCGKSPSDLDSLNIEIAKMFRENKCCFVRKVTPHTVLEYAIWNTFDWESILVYWQSLIQTISSSIPREVSKRNTIQAVLDVIATRDYTACRAYVKTNLPKYKNLIPCLYDADRYKSQVLEEFNIQLYIGKPLI